MTEERYEIKGKIGQGGVGAVYKAYDTQLRRDVAIKRVLADDELAGSSDNATASLLKEATALSSVQHPHICTVYDAGIDEDGPFVVMELINGKTLDKMVEKGTLTYEDFREVAIQCQEAMIAAQDLNLVHRDLKPSNVMVSWLPSGRFQIKLVDFGLAKFSAKPSLQTIDHGDAVFGSIFFMAPEQFERTPLDQRTDMYSLGAMFYYALTGNYPFDGDSAPQVMASHLQNSVVPLHQVRPDLPVWLSEWVMWHIQRDMNHRPVSAQIALEKFLADETLAADGGLGVTQQLITPAAPAAPGSTGPIFVSPQTGSQIITPATAGQAVTPSGTQYPHGSSPVGVQPQEPVQQMSAAEEAAYLAAQKSGMGNKQKTIIFSILGAAIVLAVIAFLVFKDDKDKNELFNNVVNQKNHDAPGQVRITRPEFDAMLNSLEGKISSDRPTTANRNSAMLILMKSVSNDGSFKVPDEVTNKAVNKSADYEEDVRANMFKVGLAHPNTTPTIDSAILKYIQDNPDSESSARAVTMLSSNAEVAKAGAIINLIAVTQNPGMRSSSENYIKTLLFSDKLDKSQKAPVLQQILAAYKSATGTKESKNTFLKLLGNDDSDEALSIIMDSLLSDNPGSVNMALKALGSWSDLRPFEPLLKLINSETKNKKKFTTTVVSILKNQPAPEDAKYSVNWQQLAESIDDVDLKFMVIRARVKQVKEPWAKAAIQALITDGMLKTNFIREAGDIIDTWAEETE